MPVQLEQIKASAGSGKTYTLTRRFLALLEASPQAAHTPQCPWQPAAPEQKGAHTPQSWGDILAVTFTNAAATEMRERVIRDLKGAALGLAGAYPINAAQARAWVDIILRQYGALNIRTIDSLLNMLVRTAALDLGLPPDFVPAFTIDEVLLPILDAHIERAWQGDATTLKRLHDACRALITEWDSNGFTAKEKLVTPLRNLLETLLRGQGDSLSSAAELRASLHQLQQTALTDAHALLTALEAQPLDVNKNFIKALHTFCSDVTKDMTKFLKESLDDSLNKTSKGRAPAELHALYARFATHWQAFHDQGTLLRNGLRHLPFVELGQSILQELAAFQQQESKVPSAIMARLAQEVLELQHGVPSALCRLGSRLSHVLIDEFQDTSREQWEALRPLIIEALSTGGSLTWVGDVKQAIYSWRGGDATLFDGISNDPELRAISPEVTFSNLTTNWRSLENIVRFNNALTAPLGQADTAVDILWEILPKFPKEIVEHWSVRVAAAFAQAGQDVRSATTASDPSGGYVTLRTLACKKTEELNEEVHAALLERLRDDVLTRFSPGEVAILVRGNKQAKLVASWLMEEHIPVITENSLLMHEHPLVRESLAWLTWLANPQDDLSFWTVVTGHILGPCLPAECSPQELALWAGQRQCTTMQAGFKERFPAVWERFFAPFHARANVLTAYDSAQEWYRLCRVRERFPREQTFVRRFLELLHMAEGLGHTTPATFMEYWSEHGEEEKVPMPETADAVRVMTIHKSKGLQFPVVLMPWTNFDNIAPKDVVPCTLGDLHFLTPLCKEMGEEYYHVRARNVAETLHLFYVACTRAEAELHLFLTTPTQAPNSIAVRLHTLLDAAGIPTEEDMGEPVYRADNAACPDATDTGVTGVGATQQAEAETPARAPDIFPDALPDASPPLAPLSPEEATSAPDAQWHPMSWLPRLKVYRNPLQEIFYSPKQRGIFVHHCLEHLRFSGDPVADARRAVQEGAGTFPHALPDIEAQLPEITDIVAWFATLPQASIWLRHGMPEQSIMDADGALHRVDLLVPPTTPASGYVCLDYKTGAPHDSHSEQVRRYLRLLDALPQSSGLPPARGLLVYLDRRECLPVSGEPQTPAKNGDAR